MKKQFTITSEELKLNRIIEIYSLILNNNTFSPILIDELLSYKKEDGSWSVIDSYNCDSDIIVHYCFIPTYYATAALMFLDDMGALSIDSKEKIALNEGLKFAALRKLIGHGYSATRTRIDSLNIYKKAGLYNWIKKNSDSEFSLMILDILDGFRQALETNRTYSDWDIDFKEEFEKELMDFNSASTKYIWYACYGSNINKTRFMKYISRCSDTSDPVEDRPYTFPHNMYFAKSSILWNNGGKAFLDDRSEGLAYGRIYKITATQFEEIKSYEGIDYSKRLYLGYIDNIPVYSFTDTSISTISRAPSAEYFSLIYEGLTDCFSGLVENTELLNYLIKCVFPNDTFTVAKTVKEKDHYISNIAIAEKLSLPLSKVTAEVNWLIDHKILKQDNRSIRAGHSISSPEAFFYTEDTSQARGLLETILKLLSFNDMINAHNVENIETSGSVEGGRHSVTTSRIERNPQNRIEAIKIHGYTCQVCGFNFETAYGDLGKNYIEVHHINPLAEQGGEHVVNPETDLACLCSNCHSMIHRNRHHVLSLDELKFLLK